MTIIHYFYVKIRSIKLQFSLSLESQYGKSSKTKWGFNHKSLWVVLCCSFPRHSDSQTPFFRTWRRGRRRKLYSLLCLDSPVKSFYNCYSYIPWHKLVVIKVDPSPLHSPILKTVVFGRKDYVWSIVQSPSRSDVGWWSWTTQSLGMGSV